MIFSHLSQQERTTWYIVLGFLVLLTVGGILFYYYGYIAPNIFYNDTIKLSYTDSNNSTYYLQNTKDGSLNWVTDINNASLLKIKTGSSPVIGGRIFSNTNTFTLFDSFYAAFLLVKRSASSQTIEFSKTSSSQFMASNDTTNGLRTQGYYKLLNQDSLVNQQSDDTESVTQYSLHVTDSLSTELSSNSSSYFKWVKV